jgi:Protein of unknown function (DUF1552)
MNSTITRRRILQGMMGASAITVGLPILNMFMNDSGTALASGAPLPTRFGTWFWGLGMTQKIFVPTRTGADFDVPEELAALADVKQHINLFTNFRLPRDGQTNFCHYTGWVALRCGEMPTSRGDLPQPSIDVLVSDAIGGGTRFRSLELAATGEERDSYSFFDSNTVNPPSTSALDFYQRVFGPEFQDPNNPNGFKPDPKILVRKSALSFVGEQRKDLMRTVGTEDRQRLDQYFTGIRDLENRLDLQLQRPAPAEACSLPPGAPKDLPNGKDVELVAERHAAMTQLLVLALACNQTKVFNMVYSASNALTTHKGQPTTHHTTTHEELDDAKLGYQVEASWFIRRAMEQWAYFVKTLASFKEGDSTLLDRSLIYAHSDQALAKIHSIDGIPMMTAGRANGRVKTGLHVDGKGVQGTSLGFTVQRIMGLPVSRWGTKSLDTDRELSEIIA